MPAWMTSLLRELVSVPITPANRVLGKDKKRIRAKDTVLDKGKSGLAWFLSKIADWARMCCSSAPNRRSARTGRRPRTFCCRSPTYLSAYADRQEIHGKRA